MKEPHDTLSVSRTLAAMLIAPLGAGVAYLAWAATQGAFEQLQGAFAVMVIVTAYSGAAGLMLVLPVLLLFPSLRRPPYWLAATWGAALASLATLALMGPRMTSFSAGTAMAILGAVSGVAYSIAARALSTKSVAE